MNTVVMLVDDEPHVTAALSRGLHRKPYELLVARGGTEALATLSRRHVDVIVTDEQMPGMKGTELLAFASRSHPETLRIILTGQASLDAAIRAINEGHIHRYLVKPCEAEQLAQVIDDALAERAKQAAQAEHRQQADEERALLRELERESPGLGSVARDDEGAVLIDASLVVEDSD